ncbi:MAG TPA: thiamine pyrophosphate-dependent dehydrogenase E1 component subunit alpha [Caulobacteraceae bacterium]|nr:thiamine pyrophosphate-dependent dehydrogenase E1 component subunit alpha [Caulobacteraceae bacterium]
MLLIREFETALATRPDHGFQLLSSGEEAVAVGVCSALRPEDQLLTGGRSIGPALARGVDPSRLMAELVGRVDGINRGRAGRGHLADPQAGFFGAHAVVAGNISIAAGVALAGDVLERPGIVAVMFGDGAFGAGALHETLNMAALWRLPVLFICNNNGLSVSTSREAALAPARLPDLPRAYGIEGATADGMDLDAVCKAARDAASHIRGGAGPRFLELQSERFGSHSTSARETRSREQLATIRARCPIVRTTAALIARDQLAQDGADALRREAQVVVRRALAFADASPAPSPHEAMIDVW